MGNKNMANNLLWHDPFERIFAKLADEKREMTAREAFRLRVLHNKSDRIRFSPLKPIKTTHMVNHWTHHYDECDESGQNIYVFATNDVETVVAELNEFTYLEGYSPSSLYDCTGKGFLRQAYITVVGSNRILVTQMFGRDV